MDSSRVKLGPPLSTLELFVQAAKLLEKLPEGLNRFEKYALLEALRDRCAREVTIPEMLMVYASLKSTFSVDSPQIEVARSEYLAGKIAEMIKAEGYGQSVQLKWENGVEPEPALLDAAFGFLRKSGLLTQSPDGSFSQTLDLWKDEIQRIRGHLEQLLQGFGALSESQRSNYPELAREYRRLLDVTKETSQELQIFNEAKIARLILRRTEGEERHLDQHHPGPWITNMAKEYGKFLRDTIPKLSQTFRVI
jgi:hypothetical protein